MWYSEMGPTEWKNTYYIHIERVIISPSTGLGSKQQIYRGALIYIYIYIYVHIAPLRRFAACLTMNQHNEQPHKI